MIDGWAITLEHTVTVRGDEMTSDITPDDEVEFLFRIRELDTYDIKPDRWISITDQYYREVIVRRRPVYANKKIKSFLKIEDGMWYAPSQPSGAGGINLFRHALYVSKFTVPGELEKLPEKLLEELRRLIAEKYE